jgi:hypothetical protein
MDSCNKAEETDADLSLRANLKVVQASFIMKNLADFDQLLAKSSLTNYWSIYAQGFISFIFRHFFKKYPF